MSEINHTPGPWLIVSHTGEQLALSRADDFTIYGANKRAIVFEATGPSAADETLANAHLIAAAPDLYAALEACADSLEAELQARYPIEAAGHSPYPNIKRRYDRDMDEVHRARAALARARGEQSS